MPAFVICPLSVVPIRMGSTNRSEMGSQLLFGEMAEVLETKGRQWTKIRCLHDDYIGWIPSGQLRDLSPAEAVEYKTHFAFSLDTFYTLMGTTQGMPIPLGAHLPGFDGMRFSLGAEDFTFSGQAVFPEDIKPAATMVLKIARKFINAPFLWGGRTIFGVDSAALVQLAYGIAGYSLPRRPEMQVNRGEIVDFVEQALPGDIAFFENKQGKITHSGILLPDGQIIHVHEKVRIDMIDHYGVFNLNEGNYTHRLRVVKRIFAPENTKKPSVKEKKEEDTQQRVLF